MHLTHYFMYASILPVFNSGNKSPETNESLSEILPVNQIYKGLG